MVWGLRWSSSLMGLSPFERDLVPLLVNKSALLAGFLLIIFVLKIISLFLSVPYTARFEC
jgi:hypothetical protein